MEKIKGYDQFINFHVCGAVIHCASARSINGIFEAEATCKSIDKLNLEKVINIIRLLKLSYDNCDHCKEEVDFLLKK